MEVRKAATVEKRHKEGQTYNCCTDEATRRRGRYRHKDGRESDGNKQRDEAKNKKEERREKI